MITRNVAKVNLDSEQLARTGFDIALIERTYRSPFVEDRFLSRIAEHDTAPMPKHHDENLIPVNAGGHRIGQHHHNARISDEMVGAIRTRHEEHGWGYKRISEEFGIALTTVRKICTYERRGQVASRWKPMKVKNG